MKRTTRTYAAALAAIALLTLGACAGDDSTGSTRNSSAALEQGSDNAPTRAAEPDHIHADESSSGESAESARDAGPPSTQSVADPDPGDRSVISTGTVSLRSADVAKTRFEVQKAIDTVAGTIGDEETTTDRDGQVSATRLVIRVPAASFDEAMTTLAGAGDLVGTTRSARDVSVEVIDVAARIRAQEKSLQRIEALLAEADDLAELVRIEAELTNRQAALDASKSRQAWLADQTSMSTITVHVQHHDEAVDEEPAADDDRNPFLAGLLSGWGALGAAGAVLAEVTGAALPFAAMVLLLGVGARFGWRRFRRAGRPARTPSAA
ncbi:DUF4349 domain-containing protein [Nocardioides sp. AE5]|uniref:DUF4349 domain-containing protein n=1 Tax=Nocardioides sp. AE5 TaxID=2962573 RepID=UPI0028824893|nr:DUF4349 domain-containing protein [Nocardioides sp. AE5]MDT0203778.1 DUF4349 domain-containing protein [Nocardioides sp. AE5]